MLLKTITQADCDLLSTFFMANDVDEIRRWFVPFQLNRASAIRIACETRADQFYLGLVDDEPIGFSMLRGWDDGYEVPSFGMFVDHLHWGRGYGKQILDLTIERARAVQCHSIRLTVFEKNVVAYNLYVSRGFIEKERFQKLVGTQIVTTILMLKDL